MNPNNLPKQEDTMLPNPFVSIIEQNTYKYVGEEEVDGIDCYKYEVMELIPLFKCCFGSEGYI